MKDQTKILEAVIEEDFVTFEEHITEIMDELVENVIEDVYEDLFQDE